MNFPLPGGGAGAPNNEQERMERMVRNQDGLLIAANSSPSRSGKEFSSPVL
jgi:hypothetical protein